jgi:anti-sigma regulatory factor (Ser/Thr protein kinase)
VTSSPARSSDDPVHLRVTSEPSCLARVRGLVADAARGVGFSEADVSCMALATNEAIANVIQHGYEGRAGEPIDVTIEPVTRAGRAGLQVLIDDEGRQVDPSQICSRDLDDVRPGGLGTHIIRSVMDEVEYLPREAGGMRLRLLKMIPAGGDEMRPCPSPEDAPHDDT